MIGEIQYGNVVLDVTKVNEVKREVILSDDGVDYLYTKVTLDVMATWSPSATSYNAVAGNIPTAGYAYAGRTDRALSDYLSQPRLQLVVKFRDANGADVDYIRSPINGANGGPLPSDAKNGPLVSVFSVVETHGIKTWTVHLQFVTYVNSCYDKTSPILSHRWERFLDIDEDYYATLTTRGVVVFNVGRLWAAEQSPDWYTAQFFQAPAQNFVRQKVNVQVTSDCTRAVYTVVDHERPFSYGSASPATRIEAILTNWYSQGSVGAAIARSNREFSFRDPLGNWDRLFRANGDSLPKYYASIKVRAWGARGSNRYDLMRLCFAIAYSRVSSPQFFSLASVSELMVSQALDAKFVELDYTLRWSKDTLLNVVGPAGPMAGAISQLVFDPQVQGFFSSWFPVNENIENLNLAGFPGTVGLSQNGTNGNRPVNPASTIFRDTKGPGYMQFMMTQGLIGQCQPQPSPVVWDQAAGVPGVPAITVAPMPSAPAAPPIAPPS